MTGTLHNEEQECSDAGSIIDDDKVILGEVKRGLKPRHVQMIAIKGTIGTSVSLSAGAFVASAVSQQVTPAGVASLFDITAQLFAWDGSAFVAQNSALPGGAVIVPGPFSLVLPVASGGDTAPGGIDFAYYLEIKGTPAAGAGNAAGYGGSLNLAAVPEPSSLLLLLGGTVFAAFLGRRRLTSST